MKNDKVLNAISVLKRYIIEAKLGEIQEKDEENSGHTLYQLLEDLEQKRCDELNPF